MSIFKTKIRSVTNKQKMRRKEENQGFDCGGRDANRDGRRWWKTTEKRSKERGRGA